HKVLLIASAAAAVLVAVLLWGDRRGYGWLMTSGPVSSAHAAFETACESCHIRGGEVADERCSTCHERFGGTVAIYSFDAHYLHGTRDLDRLASAEADELPCRSCHVEHRGRRGTVSAVADARCRNCHELASFDSDHPEFDFAADSMQDDGALRFPHVLHVREALRADPVLDLEASCLTCHEPRADGAGFGPLDFDRHCRACHLPPSTGTPRLPIDEGPGGRPGVVPWETIVRQAAPGRAPLVAGGPEAFRLTPGNRLEKRPVVHADPWILENLRRLRLRLYAAGALADLLPAGGELATACDVEAEEIYAEALANLRAAAASMGERPEPEIQADLRRIRAALARLAERVRDPTTPLDLAAFDVAPGPSVGALRASEIEAVIADLTEPCVECHQLDRGAIVRVRENQRTLRRAEFDHRAHVLQAGCLDCHDRIPVAEAVVAADPPPGHLDRAEIHNLPTIATCRQCHTTDKVATDCVGCHLFHPDKARHSRLLVSAPAAVTATDSGDAD
ncbi:MAG: cytochrome c3 family protein, partial [Thermoanaerobaculia bacterium]|nr:cytochrome c3 family protein [Thermoanaerobaculia bacterium]